MELGEREAQHLLDVLNLLCDRKEETQGLDIRFDSSLKKWHSEFGDCIKTQDLVRHSARFIPKEEVHLNDPHPIWHNQYAEIHVYVKNSPASKEYFSKKPYPFILKKNTFCHLNFYYEIYASSTVVIKQYLFVPLKQKEMFVDLSELDAFECEEEHKPSWLERTSNKIMDCIWPTKCCSEKRKRSVEYEFVTEENDNKRNTSFFDANEEDKEINDSRPSVDVSRLPDASSVPFVYSTYRNK